MGVKKLIRAFTIVAIVSCHFACDQISKKVIRNRFEYEEEVSYFDRHFIITKIENTGAFLSLGDSLPSFFRVLLLTVLPSALLVFIIGYLVFKTQLPKLTVLSICFMLGGGLGNVYDRVLYGSVTDFLFLDLGLFRTGVFNMADVSITAGVGLMLLQSYLQRQDKHVA